MAQAGKRAAVYCRISDDRRGDEAGVTDQRVDCLALVERKGWTLVRDAQDDVFTDNDITAFSGRTRPAYDRLVEAVRAGEVDVIVTVHIDRLYRRPVELEALIGLVERTKIDVSTVRAGLFDLSTRQGITAARFGVVIANDSSMATRERVQRAMLRRAEQGKVHGRLRTYGYIGKRNEDKTYTFTVVPEEAAVIRDAAQRVLAGESLLSVVNDLNARSVPTLTGKRWSRSTLRGVLISARVAGWREHTPGRKSGSEESPPHGSLWRGGVFVAEGEWPPILTKAEVERLRRRLTDPSRGRAGTTRRSHLLSNGLVVCALCGKPLRGRPNASGSSDYACVGIGGNGNGCGKVSVRAEALEDYVLSQVREAVGSGAVERALREQGHDIDVAAGAVAGLEREVTALGEDYGHGRITRQEWMAARGPLTARLESARRDLQRREGAEALSLVSGGVAAWDGRWQAAAEAEQVDKQRAMLRAMLASVAVGPVLVRGRNRFDADRVRLEWHA